MDITEVRLRRIETDGRTKAVASVTFDDCFVVHEVKLVQGRDRKMFISMPSRRLPGGEYLDIAHPVTTSTRRYIENELARVYEEAVHQGRRHYRTCTEAAAE